MAYGRFSLAHYGSPFSTDFVLDTGHLAENLVIQLRLIAKGSWWPLDVLAALLLVAMMAARAVLRDAQGRSGSSTAACCARRRHADSGDRSRRHRSAELRACRERQPRASKRIRFRYLTLTNLFGPVGGLLTAFLLLKAAVPALRKRYLETASVVAAMAWLAVAFPKARLSLEYLRDGGNRARARPEGAARSADGQLLGHLCVHRAAGRRSDGAGNARRQRHENALDEGDGSARQ